MNEKIYKKITTLAKDLVSTGEKIESEFGIPIVNKRISITPVALVGGSACKNPFEEGIGPPRIKRAPASMARFHRRLLTLYSGWF